MPCSPEMTPPSDRASSHDAADDLVRLLQHRVVVGVDRNVGVHVAVAGVHVQGDEHAALQHALVHGIDLARESASNARPSKSCMSGSRTSVFHDTRST